MEWAKRLAIQPFLVREALVYKLYKYLHERREVKAATSGGVFCSLNYAGGCLGMDGAFGATSNPRVKGFCVAQRASKRPLKQARTHSTD
eukprot:1780870-Amphidinium_carterae.2